MISSAEIEVCKTLRTIAVGDTVKINMLKTTIEYLWWVECNRDNLHDLELIVTERDRGCFVSVRPWSESPDLLATGGPSWLAWVIGGSLLLGLLVTCYEYFSHVGGLYV